MCSEVPPWFPLLWVGTHCTATSFGDWSRGVSEVECQSEGTCHLSHAHGFGFEDVAVPPEPALHDIHAELHEQGREHQLATHLHRWEIIEVHSGHKVSPRFETEQEAEDWAVRTFGPESGKEYVPRLAWEMADP